MSGPSQLLWVHYLPIATTLVSVAFSASLFRKYLVRRSPHVGWWAIGVAFYGMNKLFAHIGLLNTWPPLIVAALPSLVVLGLAFSALYWIERR